MSSYYRSDVIFHRSEHPSCPKSQIHGVVLILIPHLMFSESDMQLLGRCGYPGSCQSNRGEGSLVSLIVGSITEENAT